MFFGWPAAVADPAHRKGAKDAEARIILTNVLAHIDQLLRSELCFVFRPLIGKPNAPGFLSAVSASLR